MQQSNIGKVKLNVEESCGNSCGGPVYNEPYERFFAENGFKHDGHTYCDLLDEAFRSLSLELIEDDGDDYLLCIEPYVNLSREIFYQPAADVSLDFGSFQTNCRDGNRKLKLTYLHELVGKESNGENVYPAIRTMLEEAEKAGCIVWHGYEIGIITDGSRQIAVLKEDFSGAKQKMESLLDFAQKSMLDIYARLDRKAVKKFFSGLPSLYGKLDRAYSGAFSQLEKESERVGSMNIDSEEEKQKLEAEAQNIINRVVDNWLKTYETALNASGIAQCSTELYQRVADYCSLNGIKLCKSESGNALRKTSLLKIIEDIMR